MFFAILDVLKYLPGNSCNIGYLFPPVDGEGKQVSATPLSRGDAGYLINVLRWRRESRL